MKRTTMKSSIAQQPRCRPEGRLFPRRRVAVKSHLLNGVGDFEMELSLAIQESLKYAQQEKVDEVKENGFCDTNGPRSKESEHKRDSVAVPNNKNDLPRVTNKAVHSASAVSSSDWVSEEVGRLKDLLMSQAELIQCQQDEIAMKDREIKSLISARDALQCRLDRMERRMSMLKHKEESHDISGMLAVESPIKAPFSQPVHQKGLNEISVTEFKRNRRRGQRLHFSQRKRHKRQKLMKPEHSVADTDREEEEDDSENDDDDEEEEEEEEEEDEEEQSSAESDSEKADEQNNSLDSEGQALKNDDDEQEIPAEQEERTIDYPIMQTETLYHLYYPKNFCPSPDAKKLQEQTEVETPSWRLKPMTNLYQLEGTENITDEAYFKRHQKFELEEKRRKRWDLQRLRELRLSEKIQRQREDAIRASQDEADVETFLPSIHDLKHIEKTEMVPVMAFGQPVPYVSPAEFEIPWEIIYSGPINSVGRQRSNSVHSKKL